MELILQGCQGAPEGSILSIRVGDTKRQGPVSGLGKPFRFGTSLAEPLPLTMELLSPVAPAQVMTLGPATSDFEVDFGGPIKVQLLQREAPDAQKPAVNVSAIASDFAAARSIPQKKLDLAHNAASYLQQHDLVRMFQDILHGLLVSKPQDPFDYIEAHFQRARALAQVRQGGVIPPKYSTVTQVPASPDSPPPPPLPPKASQAHVPLPPKAVSNEVRPAGGIPEEQIACKQAPAVVASSARVPLQAEPSEDLTLQAPVATGAAPAPGPSSDAEDEAALAVGAPEPPTYATPRRRRVDNLIERLLRTKNAMLLVMPFLPADLVEQITTEALGEDCARVFDGLDKNSDGALSLSEVPPLLCQLGSVRKRDVSPEQCAALIQHVDANSDGKIQVDEFQRLATYVMVAYYLDSDEGLALVNDIASNKRAMAHWLQKLREDKDMLMDVLPLLPEEVQEKLTSHEFVASCMEQYDSLDTDGSGALESAEVLPVIAVVGGIDPAFIDREHCMDFVSIFSPAGVIRRDDFVQLVRFVWVAGFLQTESRGSEDDLSNRAGSPEPVTHRIPRPKRVDRLIDTLQRAKNALPLIVPFLPPDLFEQITADAFAEDCAGAFRELDRNADGSLSASELPPLICHLGSVRTRDVSPEQCAALIQRVDANNDGQMQAEEFQWLVTYVMVAAYLESEEGLALVDDILANKRAMAHWLQKLREDTDMLMDVVPLLPDEMLEKITSHEFVASCMEQYDTLDTDGSGALESAEVVPVIAIVGGIDPAYIDREHCVEFVSIFSPTGVIRRDDFVQLVRFVWVAGFLQSQSGGSEDDLSKCGGSPEPLTHRIPRPKRVDRLIDTLQHAKNALPLIMPFLPPDLFEQITADAFAEDCAGAFGELDRNADGSLSVSELPPLICHLGSVRTRDVSPEQCAALIQRVDANSDGEMQPEEFRRLVTYVMVAAYLESEEGAALVDDIAANKRAMAHWLQSLREDKDMLMDVLPLLPEEVQEKITSHEFVASCMEQYDSLDTDGSGALESAEVLPVIAVVGGIDPALIDREHCVEFSSIFSPTGVITRDDFVQLVRFVWVASFLLAESGEDITPPVPVAAGVAPQLGAGGEDVREVSAPSAPTSDTPRRRRVDGMLQVLQYTKNALPLVLPFLPPGLVDYITTEALGQDCACAFGELDKNADGSLSVSEVPPLICRLSSARQQDVSPEQCAALIQRVDANSDGKIQAEEFRWLVTYVMVGVYLESEEGLAIVEDIRANKRAMAHWLQKLREDKDMLMDLMPFLPDEVREKLTSHDFVASCMEQYDSLDTDGSGALESVEVMPVIAAVGGVDPALIDREHCVEFVSIFSPTGGISRDDFVQLVRFVWVASFLQAESGEGITPQAPVAAGAAPALGPLLEAEGEEVWEATPKHQRVERALQSLQRTKTYLPLVTLFLPPVLVDFITTEAVGQDCARIFSELDKNDDGSLSVSELPPLICRLCSTRAQDVTVEQCAALIRKVDANHDKMIQLEEFRQLVIYVMVAFHLETEAGLALFDWLQKVRDDDETQLQLVPMLSDSLQEILDSPDFMASCMASFDELDSDGSGVLEGAELAPAIASIGAVDPARMSREDCADIIKIFSPSGVIERDDFVRLTRFVLLLVFLHIKPDKEGAEEDSAIEHAVRRARTKKILTTLEDDWRRLPEIMPLLSEELVAELRSEEFLKACGDGFDQLDKNGNGLLDPIELLPLLTSMCEGHTIEATESDCMRLLRIFDRDKNGVIQKEELVSLAQFMIIMGYLKDPEGLADIIPCDEQEIIDSMLSVLREGMEHMDDALDFLPDSFKAEILGPEFAAKCVVEFESLDEDGNNELDWQELMPILANISNASTASITSEQAARFVEIFDADASGLINQAEFVAFARFMLVMAFLESDEAQHVAVRAEEGGEKPCAAASSPEPERPTTSPSGPTEDLAAENEAKHVAVSAEEESEKPCAAASSPDPERPTLSTSSPPEDLAAENEALRRRMGDLEKMVSLMEQRLNDQEARYQALVEVSRTNAGAAAS